MALQTLLPLRRAAGALAAALALTMATGFAQAAPEPPPTAAAKKPKKAKQADAKKADKQAKAAKKRHAKKDKRGDAIQRAAAKGADKSAPSDPKQSADDGVAVSKATPADDGSPTQNAAWVVKKPSSETQTQKTAEERGINPCNTPDPGWGVYEHWSRAPSMGQMIMPGRGGVANDGGFDVMFHFHGHEPVRKEWVRVMDGAVLVGIDLGIGSGPYASAFSSPETFKRLVESVERAVAQKTGKKNAHVRKVGLSAWSAGYGAVGEILSQPYGKQVTDAVILLDGLHSGYAGDSLNEAQLKPFVEFAKQAAGRQKLMFVSHSSIIPPGYASTTETANFLVQKLGGKPKKSKPRGSDPMGLDMNQRFSKGTFHVRGYNGNDKMDHCAHIGLLRDVLKVHVKSRWSSPTGHAAKR